MSHQGVLAPRINMLRAELLVNAAMPTPEDDFACDLVVVRPPYGFEGIHKTICSSEYHHLPVLRPDAVGEEEDFFGWRRPIQHAARV